MPSADRKPELAIAPEPSAEAHEAIALAVTQAAGGPVEPAGRSAWWRAGVRESVSPPPGR